MTFNWRPPWPCAVFYSAGQHHGVAGVRDPSAQLAPALRALGHPSRLRLLQALASRPWSTMELAQRLGTTEPAVSKQVKQLEHLGLVEGRREGHFVMYSLCPSALRDLTDDLIEYLGGPESSAPSIEDP